MNIENQINCIYFSNIPIYEISAKTKDAKQAKAWFIVFQCFRYLNFF